MGTDYAAAALCGESDSAGRRRAGRGRTDVRIGEIYAERSRDGAKSADKGATDGREVTHGRSGREEWEGWMGKNEIVGAVTRLLSLLLFWVRDASGPRGNVPILSH